MIVDQADEDLEMAEDPFLEAGIEIPYQVTDIIQKEDKLSIAASKASDVANAFLNIRCGSHRTANTFSEKRERSLNVFKDSDISSIVKDENSKTNTYLSVNNEISAAKNNSNSQLTAIVI